jgi:2-phosphoglycerate kinase
MMSSINIKTVYLIRNCSKMSSIISRRYLMPQLLNDEQYNIKTVYLMPQLLNDEQYNIKTVYLMPQLLNDEQYNIKTVFNAATAQ